VTWNQETRAPSLACWRALAIGIAISQSSSGPSEPEIIGAIAAGLQGEVHPYIVGNMLGGKSAKMNRIKVLPIGSATTAKIQNLKHEPTECLAWEGPCRGQRGARRAVRRQLGRELLLGDRLPRSQGR
jgi:uncharacterized membrane protein YuzA (DUF378 family)